MKNLIFALMLAFGASSMYAAPIQSANNSIEQQNPKKKKTATKKATAKKTTVKKTTVKKTAVTKSFVGNHMLSLQWISWEKFGKAVITQGAEEGVYNIVGRQGAECCDEAEGKNNGDFVSIEGTIRKVDEKTLIFNGKITTRVYHINNGENVVREGEYTFLSTQGRKYWRLQDMKNPTGDGTDYVDIYF